MDSKKWYDRIATCFWLFLATLPLWVALFGFIGQYLGRVPEVYQGNASFDNVNAYYKSFSYYINDIMGTFEDFTPSFMRILFVDLCDLIDTENSYVMYNLLAWFSWVFFLHLMTDFITWLPKFFHKIMSKGVDLK